ncbi:MAG: nucleotidyltransferase domain-containing protein [Kiritimatiellia bacterium]|jgi:predicted nucleotidyltransferase|nr:nucleotidyltransferase domain-containing protein [Kiritimatiellia bacterium]
MLDNSDTSLDEMISSVLAQHPLVKVGYLFGSACTARCGPLSDIDIAVLVDDGSARKACEGEIQDALCRALRTGRVDLVSLSDAPSSLSYRVIREGRCVYCSERKAREAFETDTVMRYLDFKPVREQAFRTSRKRILETA